MPSQLILVRQPGLREISKEDVRAGLDDAQLRLEHEWVDVDMRPFASDVEAGIWEALDQFLREQAARVHQLADAMEAPEIHYFGLAEVPQIVALGAHLGLERKVVVHEYDRQVGGWRWPEVEESIQIETTGIPGTVPIPQRGIAPWMLEVSYPISDADVASVIGEETFPAVRLRPIDGAQLGRVRSPADLEAVRRAIRGALANMRTAYPNLEAIHLFAAVPTSVAFVLGQELVPRNTPAVHTYRYRADGEPKQRAAIIVRSRVAETAVRPLAAEERSRARRLRTGVWAEEIEVLREQATRLRAVSPSGLWYAGLAHRKPLETVAPFPRLARLADLVPPRSVIAEDPYLVSREYRYIERSWQISDELALNLGSGCESEATHRQRIRLFLIHEHVHHHHMITGDTANEVGKFANALEHVDYTADFYALCHEMDRAACAGEFAGMSEFDVVQRLAAAVDEIIRSFWAFEEERPRIWEIRRLRRHFNWYWQLARLGEARTLEAAFRTLARKPVVEIAGLHARTQGRRIEVDLERFLPSTALEIAVVLDDDSLDRRGAGGATDPRLLCKAMVERDHEALRSYFRALERFARARQPG
jgi:hypothetical protein